MVLWLRCSVRLRSASGYVGTQLIGYGLSCEVDVPRKKFVDPGDGMVCDLSEDVVEIKYRVEAVELG